MFTKTVYVQNNDYKNTLKIKYKNVVKTGKSFIVSGTKNGNEIIYNNNSVIYSGQKHIGTFDENYIMQGKAKIYFNNGFIYIGCVKDGIPHGHGKMIKPESITNGLYNYFTLVNGIVLYKKNPHIINISDNSINIVNKVMDLTPDILEIKFKKNNRFLTIMNRMIETICDSRKRFKILLNTNSPVTIITEEFVDLLENNLLQFKFINAPELGIIKTGVILSDTIDNHKTKGILIGLNGLKIT